MGSGGKIIKEHNMAFRFILAVMLVLIMFSPVFGEERLDIDDDQDIKEKQMMSLIKRN